MSIKKKIVLVCLTALTAALMMPAAAFAADWSNPNFREDPAGVVKWDTPAASTTFTLRVENKQHSEIWFNATPGGAEMLTEFNIKGFLGSMAAPDGTYVLQVWPQNGYDPKTYDYVYSSLNGTLEAPKNLEWNGYVMTWDPVPYAAKYYLEIYRNDTLDSANGYTREAPSNQVAIDTSRFSPGDKISFRVRAMNPAAGYGSSLWSGKSGELEYGNVSDVTLSFDANGGSGTMDSKTGAPGTVIFGGAQCGFTAPGGKEFDCWELPDGQKLLGHESLTVYGDTELKALWKDAPAAAAYTVTFDSTGGSAVVAQTVEEGQKATKPADPTKEGYDFAGWTFEGKAWDFDSNTVTGDITLVAEWKAKDAGGNDGGGEPGIPEGGNDQPTGPEGDDPSGEQPKKPEPNDGKPDAEGALAQTGDDVPFAGLFAAVAAAGIAVLALRRRVA